MKQGDPLGSALRALGNHPCLVDIAQPNRPLRERIGSGMVELPEASRPGRTGYGSIRDGVR